MLIINQTVIVVLRQATDHDKFMRVVVGGTKRQEFYRLIESWIKREMKEGCTDEGKKRDNEPNTNDKRKKRESKKNDDDTHTHAHRGPGGLLQQSQLMAVIIVFGGDGGPSLEECEEVNSVRRKTERHRD